MRHNGEEVCPKDCPERTWDCHGKCERYLRLYESNRKLYERRKYDSIYVSYVAKEVNKQKSATYKAGKYRRKPKRK